MQEKRIKITFVSKPYDAVLIVGSGHDEKYIKQIKDAYEESGMSYKIIGDGKRLLSFAEIKRDLNGFLTADTRIDIWGHGSVEREIHNIEIHDKSSEDIKRLELSIYGRSTIDLIRFLKKHCYYAH